MKQSLILGIFLLCISVTVQAETKEDRCQRWLFTMAHLRATENLCQLPKIDSETARNIYLGSGCTYILTEETERKALETAFDLFHRKYGMRQEDGTTINLNPQTCQVAKDMLAYPWTQLLELETTRRMR